jgi:hypothetical protein
MTLALEIIGTGFEVEGVEGLSRWQAGLREMTLDASPAAFGEFMFRDGAEKTGGGPALFVGLIGELSRRIVRSRCRNVPPRAFAISKHAIDRVGPRSDRKFKPVALGQNQTAADTGSGFRGGRGVRARFFLGGLRCCHLGLGLYFGLRLLEVLDGELELLNKLLAAFG